MQLTTLSSEIKELSISKISACKQRLLRKLLLSSQSEQLILYEQGKICILSRDEGARL